MITVLVCGGRDYDDQATVNDVLDDVLIHNGGLCRLVQGGAKGADRLAYNWARRRGVPVDTYHADWHKYGLSAGPIRNQQMLEQSQPDLVVAFPGGRGTADMVARAHKAGVEVIDLSYSTE